ncbi:hypothetical protein L1987_56637 [Smallanthus sonchifolius]|uniref:Uncharacterized protein n=1 Tax=Smallanthus sonchifolius TaxID=185202 RepID=A0ACB9ECZ9_9ASTR|nr:hypothetical protein L1987_56637 [Smallanthus sonchifolius]
MLKGHPWYGSFVGLYSQKENTETKGFSQQVKKEVFDALKPLFDLPIETKMKNTSDKPFHGYPGPSLLGSPLYESLSIEYATSYDNVQSFANLMWPFENENFRPAEEDESNVGALVHTDKPFFTILNQNQVDGLEVQIKDSDEWVEIEFLPSSFVIMETDPFMAWSNGRLRAPRHQVVMNGKENRYTIALSTFKNGTVEIPEELIDDEHPTRFKPFDHYKYLESFAKNPNYLDERAIISFCGV